MTDDQRCRTCRWWGREIPPEHLPTMGDEFQAQTWLAEHAKQPLKREAYRPCLLTTFALKADYAYDHPESLALATDHEQYGAELMTAPDFGCIQWQAKP